MLNHTPKETPGDRGVSGRNPARSIRVPTPRLRSPVILGGDEKAAVTLTVSRVGKRLHVLHVLVGIAMLSEHDTARFVTVAFSAMTADSL